MVVLVVIGHVCFKLVSHIVTVSTEEEIVAVLAHMTVLLDLFITVEALEFSIDWSFARIKYRFHRVILVMLLELSIWCGKKAFLTFVILNLQRLKFLQTLQAKQTPMIGFWKHSEHLTS